MIEHPESYFIRSLTCEIMVGRNNENANRGPSLSYNLNQVHLEIVPEAHTSPCRSPLPRKVKELKCESYRRRTCQPGFPIGQALPDISFLECFTGSTKHHIVLKPTNHEHP